MSLLSEVYAISKQVPERELQSQLNRASRSIAPLLSEGFARRNSEKEFKRYLRMALGSSDEMQTHLKQVNIIYSLPTEDLEGLYKELSRQIQRTLTVWKSDGPF